MRLVASVGGLEPGSKAWLAAIRVYMHDDDTVMQLVSLLESAQQEIEILKATKGELDGTTEESAEPAGTERAGTGEDDEWTSGG